MYGWLTPVFAVSWVVRGLGIEPSQDLLAEDSDLMACLCHHKESLFTSND